MSGSSNEMDVPNLNQEVKWQATSIRELLLSVNRIILSDDADLKAIIADRSLSTGKLKTDRQMTLIESLILESIPGLIVGTLKHHYDDVASAINSASETILKAIRSTKAAPVFKPVERDSSDSGRLNANHDGAIPAEQPPDAPDSSWTQVVRKSHRRLPNESASTLHTEHTPIKRPSSPSRIKHAHTPTATIIGKCPDAGLRGKPPRIKQHNVRSASIYVGNLESTTPSEVTDYIQTKYKTAFHEDISISKVYPLVKRDPSDCATDLNAVYATSFRIILDQSCVENVLNPLIWPTNVRVRSWQYKDKQGARSASVARSPSDNEAPRTENDTLNAASQDDIDPARHAGASPI